MIDDVEIKPNEGCNLPHPPPCSVLRLLRHRLRHLHPRHLHHLRPNSSLPWHVTTITIFFFTSIISIQILRERYPFFLSPPVVFFTAEATPSFVKPRLRYSWVRQYVLPPDVAGCRGPGNSIRPSLVSCRCPADRKRKSSWSPNRRSHAV